jgi:hypothetical protein
VQIKAAAPRTIGPKVIAGDRSDVFVYVATSKQVGDLDHLKVFASADAAIWTFSKKNGFSGGPEQLKPICKSRGNDRQDMTTVLNIC